MVAAPAEGNRAVSPTLRAATTPVPTTTIAVEPAAAPPPARETAPQVDIHHVLVTGQSNAIGTMSIPPLTTEQPYDNLMFDTGVLKAESEWFRKLVPLVEGDLMPGKVYRVETLSSGFANLVSKTAREELGTKHDVLVSIHGVGGMPYPALMKGTKPYAAGLLEVFHAQNLARATKKSYVVSAVITVHGEADHADGNPLYEPSLRVWQRDYEKDVREITGQKDPIPLFETQISNWPRYGQATSRIPDDQLTAHIKAPGKVILVGPKYHLPYGSDGIHLANEGQRHMGEDYAKAYKRVVLEGGTWEPLRPKAVTRDGNEITITFHVPAPPIVLDPNLVSNPGNFGFEYHEGSASPPKIASVTVTGPDTVKVTLTGAPDPKARKRIRYAYTSHPSAHAGPTSGPRGNLRDSDPTVSRHGYALFNWCVHFDEAVP